MTSHISPTATTAREAARSTDGKFGTQPQAEAEIDLTAGAPDPEQAAETQLLQLLEQFTVLPATDGRGNDFADAFLARHREAATFAAAHPDWETLAGEGHLKELAGLTDTPLGNVRHIWLSEPDSVEEVDLEVEDRLVLEVQTLNGGENRDCWHEPDSVRDEMGRVPGCTGCVMDAVERHPNYLDDADDYSDHGDSSHATICFRVPDQEAASLAQEAQHMAGPLRALQDIANGITTPWRHIGKGSDDTAGRVREMTREAYSLRDRASTAVDRKALARQLEGVFQAAEFPEPEALTAVAANEVSSNPWYPGDLHTATGRLTHQSHGYKITVERLVKRRTELATATRTVEEIDQVLPGLPEDGPVHALLTRERKHAVRNAETVAGLQARDAVLVEEYLSPFRSFIADADRDDPAALRAEAGRLEAEAAHQEKLIGWPEDPATFPAPLERLRS